MDRYEYKLKLGEIETLVAEKNYAAAAEIADSINWRKVRNVNSLMLVGEIYQQTGRYEDSKELFLMAYDRSPIGKKIIYRLAEIAISARQFEEAQEYYDEFVEIAPHDTLKYVLRYRMSQAKGEPYSSQIAILNELKEQEYTEEWAFELAYLYHEAGMTDKCIEACDELILWFGDGPYVEKALELKMLYQPLNFGQEEKYKQLRKKKDGIIEVRPDEYLESGEIINSTIKIPEVHVSADRFNTQNLQEELARGIQQIMEATEKETVNDTMDSIKKMVEETPYLQSLLAEEGYLTESVLPPEYETDEEIDNSLNTNFQEILEEEYDGQFSLSLPGGGAYEPQVRGQMTIEDVLTEWEKTKRAAEAVMEDAQQRKLESAKALALQETADLMERLSVLIAQLDEGVTTKELVEQVYDPESPEFMERATQAFADANERLQEEIDRLQAGQGAAQEMPVTGDVQPEAAEFSYGLTEGELPGGQEAFYGIEEAGGMEPAGMMAGAFSEQPGAAAEEMLQQTGVVAGEFFGEPGMAAGDVFGQAGMAAGDVFGQADMAAGAAFGQPSGAAEAFVGQYDGAVGEPGVMAGDISGQPGSVAEMQPDMSAGNMPQQPDDIDLEFESAMTESFKELNKSEEALAEELRAEGLELYRDPEPEPVHVQPEEPEPQQSGVRREIGHPSLGSAVKSFPNLSDLLSFDAFHGVGKSKSPELHAGTADPIDDLGILDKKEPEKQMPQEKAAKAPPVEPAEEEFYDEPEEEEERFSKMLSDWEAMKDPTTPLPEISMDLFEEQQERARPGEPEPEPEPERTSFNGIKKFDAEMTKRFSYFSKVDGMEAQICNALNGCGAYLMGAGRAKGGNLVIEGASGCGKTMLATNLVKTLQQMTGKPDQQIGKINGDALNHKDVQTLMEKISGGCLIIEQVGELSRETEGKLAAYLGQHPAELLVILEDTKDGIAKALGRHDGFAEQFGERITIPYFTNDELVEFAKTYAAENGYGIDAMAVLALYTRISGIQKLDQTTTLVEVKEIVDEAIDRVEKGSFKKMFGILTSKRYDENNYVVLHEKDFED